METTTIQLTHKKFKLHLLISWALIVLSIIGFFVEAKAPQPDTAAYSLTLFAGVVWLVVTRIRIWWNHK